MAGFRPLFAQVQDYLAAAVSAELAALPDEVACDLGYPAGGIQDRHVWVAGALEAAHPFHLSGFAQRGEDALVQVHILVTMTSDAMAEPRDEALALAGVVEDVLAEDRTLGGLVDSAAVVGTNGEEAIPEERTRQYGITLRIAYSAGVAPDA
jgi:hypothetical protein